MNNEEERRRQIRILENSKKLLFDKLDINNKMVNVMISKPHKLKPDYEFENDPKYIEVLKQKWLNDVKLDNQRIRQNIKQLDSQIDMFKKQEKKEEPKMVKSETPKVEKKPEFKIKPKKEKEKKTKGDENE